MTSLASVVTENENDYRLKKRPNLLPSAKQKVIVGIGSYPLIVKELVLFVHLINMTGSGWIFSHRLARSGEAN